MVDGTRRFVIGLGKKVLVANQVTALVDKVFSFGSADLTAATAWLGLVAYSLQIYFDFSGNSDMAIGLGRIFGFRFLGNFDYPYIAGTVREFWRRWHITLSRFCRDYLYIPLDGNRAGPTRTALNLFLVFGLCRLWHGASWNFVLWGLFHGLFLSVERVIEWRDWTAPRWLRPLGHLYTLLAVMLAWVLFRCTTWDHAATFYGALFGSSPAVGGLSAIPFDVLSSGVCAALLVGILFSVPIVPALGRLSREAALTRWVFAAACSGAEVAILVPSVLGIGAGAPNPFIYFRF